jgi:ABC-2 type transport system permease protein
MFREKQVWFWNIFFPIILMSIFMLIFSGRDGDDFKAKIAVVQPVQSEVTDAMLEGLRQIPVFEWKSEEPVTAKQADAWIRDKEVDGVIYLPENGQADPVRLVVNTENEQNATSQALRGMMDQFVMRANLIAAGVAEPIYKLEFASVTSGSQELSYNDFLLTGMIALALAQGGMFGMVDLVEMRRKGLLKRLRMTPVRMGLIGVSGMMVRFILGVFQVICLTVIGVLGFGAHLNINFPSLLAVFFVGSLAFNALGYLFSSLSKSIEAYMGLANIASFLMMFISGVFFPVNSLPEWLQGVTSFIPLTYFVEGLRDGMVYGSNIFTPDLWLSIAVMALWGALAYVIGAMLYRRAKIEVR